MNRSLVFFVFGTDTETHRLIHAFKPINKHRNFVTFDRKELGLTVDHLLYSAKCISKTRHHLSGRMSQHKENVP